MKYKITLATIGLLIVCGSGFLYIQNRAVDSLPEGVLVRETISAMGQKTITTVASSGIVTVVSAFPGQSTEYTLSSEQVAQVYEYLATENGTVHKFKPEPGVSYEGTYLLELEYRGSTIQHTLSTPQHESLMQLIKSARPK